MMFSLLKFEWQFHRRQWIFYLALLACMSMGGILMFSQPVDSDIFIAGPYRLAKMICTLAFLVLPFLVSAFAGNAIVRDRNAKITELIFSSKVSKWHYLFSRWLGLVLITSLLFITTGVGMLIALSLVDNLQFSVIQTITSILWPILLLAIPGIILLATILFTVGLFSKKNIFIYIAGTMLFLTYQLLLVKTGSVLMANPATGSSALQFIFSLLDPFGTAAFFDQVKLWTPAEKNSQFMQLSGMLLANRLLVLILSLFIFIFCYQKFAFQTEEKNSSKKRISNELTSSNRIKLADCYKPVLPKFGKLSNWLAFVSQWKFEYLATIKTRSFLAVLTFWLVILITEIISGFSPSGSLVPTPLAGTIEALWRFQYDMLPRFMSFFMVFFAAEIAWREQEHNSESFIHASPVGNISLFFAKWLALLLVPLTLITATILASASLQFIYGGFIEWPIYLSLYYYCGLPMVCVATLCLFIHNISYNKVIGMASSLLVVIFAISPAGDYIGLEHPMFSFSSHPLLQYSDLIGFSATSDAFAGFMSLWLSLSLVMLLLGYGLYRRGAMVSLRSRISFIRSQWGNIGIGCFLLTATLSGYLANQVYYQTNEVAHYQSNDDAINWRVGYELKYLQYQHLLSPTVSSVKNRMDLYPAQRRFKMHAQYILHNPHQETLFEILVSTSTKVDYSDVHIEGASLQSYDPEYGQYLFKLNKPMPPGANLAMSFSVSQQQNGYLGLVADNLIVPGFSYLRAIRYMPFFGFNEHYQVPSASLRQQLGLSALPGRKPLEQAIAERQGDFSDDYDWSTFETVISTSIDEVAISHGRLISQWQKNGRNFYHYKTTRKIRNVIAYLSGRYLIANRVVDGINLQVYYHKNHQKNVEHTLDAMSATMQYANQHFSHYPAKDLRLVEVPRTLGMTGYALPQVMLISEHGGFRDDLSDSPTSLDQVYRRTAHEVAHQWWGHGLNGAAQEGESILVETLAKYTELVLLEKKYGREYVRRLMKHEHQRYFFGRARSSENELPLYRANANHLIYSKGAIAMYALKEAIGEIAINQALRQLIQHHSYPKPPATTLDLIAALKAFSSDEQDQQIELWFKGKDISDISIVSANYQQLANTSYQVDVCLKVEKINSTEIDGQSSIATSLPAWLGILTEHPDELVMKGSDQQILKFEQVNISNTEKCLSWTVNEKPSYIAIDPFYHRLDQNRDNNVIIPVDTLLN